LTPQFSEKDKHMYGGSAEGIANDFKDDLKAGAHEFQEIARDLSAQQVSKNEIVEHWNDVIDEQSKIARKERDKAVKAVCKLANQIMYKTTHGADARKPSYRSDALRVYGIFVSGG
jgi:Asp-tRNA(Asn)/Glu-tRNA(Gln) amidotransferase B subunit